MIYYVPIWDGESYQIEYKADEKPRHFIGVSETPIEGLEIKPSPFPFRVKPEGGGG